MDASTFQTVFLVFFGLSVALQLYLSWRQSRAVAAHRPRVPTDFAATVSLEEHRKAADYTLAKQRLARYDMVFQAALLLLFTLGGGLNVLAAAAQDFSGSPLTQGVVLIVLFLLVNMVLSLPFTVYRTFKLEAAFGFNRTTAATFIADQVKGLLLALLIGVPLLYVVLYLMAAMGNNWWLYVWCVWVAFSLAMMWIFPTWIAPLFNRFQPLADDDLRLKIENLLQRTGFHSKGVFVMDGSKRSGHGNAYFTGLGRNKRIVFFDTLLNTLNHDETEAVLAHELGHFRHRHIVQQMVLNFALGLGLLWVLGQLLPQPAFYQGLGVVFPSHAMALLLFFLVLPVFVFVLSPLPSIISRRNEYQADRFAAQYAAADQLISALTKLYRDNAATLVSDGWYSRFYDSHPDARARISALKKASGSL
ncbi:MAG: M48 family metallopeptidase [Neisseria sp.]|nr:M48 family metallopeptidase [Neisseria sp.]